VTRAVLLALAAAAALLPLAGAAQQPVNPIHPAFAPLDAAGGPAARPEEVSAERTCGACHDAAAITAHGDHAKVPEATCIRCHVDGGRLAVAPLEGGKLRREDLRIGRPRNGNCAACHGIVSDGAAPVAVPADFEAPPREGRTWSLTQGEGAVVAPQRPSESFLNLAGKAERTAPWDVHAAKLVECVACHYARNDPRRADLKQVTLRALASDPRRPSTAEFLVRPDHRLARADCRGCHAPLAVHDFLPYRERHMQVLSCSACHVPGPTGPAAEAIDATAVTAAGTPVFTWRNVERAEGESLNAAVVRPLRPLLVLRTESDGVRRLAPVNVVSRWRWVTGAERAEVPFPTVVRAWRDGDRWAPAVLQALDADRDGTLSPAELRLDTPEKAGVIAARLRELGVREPAVDGVLEVHPLAHGVPGREGALRSCDACHGEDSRLSGTYALAAYLPGGVPPRPPEASRVELAGTIGPAPGGGLRFERAADALPGGLHLVGHTRQRLADGIGLLVFALVFLGVVVHALARWALRGRAARPAEAAPLREEYAFGRYERLWHWTMAAAGLGLIANGLLIRAGGGGLAGKAEVHNVLAVVLMVNAGLSLFYHLSTAAIRTFIPAPHGLLGRLLAHLRYQTRGIFYGDPDPAHAEAHKLNPVQQLTYLALLNVLFPLQIATGVAIWAVGHWPAAAAALGGLSVVAPLHDLGAWLFLTFFVLHVYLVTTGRTPGEHLRAMATGFRRVAAAPDEPQGA
jgi:thiosulfate reductase cytochrome b subunit/mono/diheme cytochrome c family protein